MANVESTTNSKVHRYKVCEAKGGEVDGTKRIERRIKFGGKIN